MQSSLTRWTSSAPQSMAKSVNSSATADVESKNICISGHNYQNGTGKGLAGWTIVVSNTTDRFTAVTNDTGYWQVCGLGGGNYTVCVVNPLGWMQAAPKGCYELIDLAAIIQNSGPITGLDFYNNPTNCNLTLTKTADKSAVHRGEDITYTINLSNPCSWGQLHQCHPLGYPALRSRAGFRLPCAIIIFILQPDLVCRHSLPRPVF